jgi:hypothetical protein
MLPATEDNTPANADRLRRSCSVALEAAVPSPADDLPSRLNLAAVHILSLSRPHRPPSVSHRTLSSRGRCIRRHRTVGSAGPPRLGVGIAGRPGGRAGRPRAIAHRSLERLAEGKRRAVADPRRAAPRRDGVDGQVGFAEESRRDGHRQRFRYVIGGSPMSVRNWRANAVLDMSPAAASCATVHGLAGNCCMLSSAVRTA